MGHPIGFRRAAAIMLAVAVVGAPALARQNSDDKNSPSKSLLNRNGKSKLPPQPPPSSGQSPAPSAPAGSPLNRTDGRVSPAYFTDPARRTLPRGYVTSGIGEYITQQGRRVLANGGGIVTTAAGDVQVGAVYDPTSAGARQRLISSVRAGDVPHDNEALRRVVGAGNLDSMRAEYSREKGYTEAHLADGATVFMRANSTCAMSRAVAILNGREGGEGCCCCCRDDDPWSQNDIMGSPDAPADPFVALEGGGDDPAPAGTMTVQEQAELGLSTQELAARALRQGRAEEAVKLFDAYIAEDPLNKEDSEGMRMYALARMRAKKMDGIKALHEVYVRDPDLAWRAVDPTIFDGGEQAVRELVDSAVRAANKARGGDGKEWLAVVVLMQAQGRSDQALKMLDRARERGLDERIAAEFAQSLKDRKPALSGDARTAR